MVLENGAEVTKLPTGLNFLQIRFTKLKIFLHV